MEEGTYGLCETTGRPIPRARLEALPCARLTVEAQAAAEKAAAAPCQFSAAGAGIRQRA